MPKETKEQIEKISKKTNTVKKLKDTTDTKVKKTPKKEKSTDTIKTIAEKKLSIKNTKSSAKKPIDTENIKPAIEKKETSKNRKAVSTKKSEVDKKNSSTKTSKARMLKTVTPMAVEYYDLPYKYNQTTVKILYQNPTTLFVYWEISEKDIENYKKVYGDNFFEITKPVLIIHNDSMNYAFEIDINDFANCWYFHINDSKCNYHVELGRRPIVNNNNNIQNNYIYISSSNKIESPNNKILFNTNENYSVYFKNTKTNNQRKVDLQKILEQLNLKNKKFEFPVIKNIFELYQNIYEVKDPNEIYNTSNPSSGNPTSGTL